VIHRDIKPSNCFRVEGPGDAIKVLDFGIARVDDPDARIGEPTTAGTVLGTPEYIAPEVAAGALAGPSADLYAVGALLYKLLTGVAPFTGASFHAVLSKQIFEPPIPPRRRAPGREIPADAEALILRALAKDPAARQPDMPALAAEIAATLGQADGPPVIAPAPAGASSSSLVGPSSDESTDSLAMLPVDPRAHEPVTAPEPIGAVRRGATLRLPAVPPRRRPLVFGIGAAAAALAGALVGARLALPGPKDMPDKAGAEDQVRSDMADRSGAATRRADELPPKTGAVTETAARELPLAAGAVTEAAARELPPATVVDAAPATGAASGPVPAPEDPAPSSPPGVVPAADVSADMLQGTSSPRRAGGSRTRPRSEPAPVSPPFDAAAAARALDGASAAVRTCALDAGMMRGELRLRVTVDAGGRLTADGAPGARVIEPAALRCIRRELGAIRLAPVAGELVHAFVL
jgi:serine/threonine-protein kinase